MGSSSAKRPSSSNIKAATVVTGLVIEAIRKMVSRSTGSSVVRSRRPTLVVCVTRPPRHTRVAAPASVSGVYIRSNGGFNGIVAEHARSVLCVNY